MTNTPSSVINITRLLLINVFITVLYILSLDNLSKKTVGLFIEKGLEQIYYNAQDYNYGLSGLCIATGYAIVMLTAYIYWFSYTTREHVRAYQFYSDIRGTDAYKRRERSMTKWAFSETRLRTRYITAAYLFVVTTVFILVRLFYSPFIVNTIFVVLTALVLFTLFCMMVYCLSTYIACKVYVRL